MSFFNLTQLGVQDTIKTGVKTPAMSIGVGPKTEKESAKHGPDRTSLKEPVYPNSEANGSHIKYTQRLHKHIRPKQGPNEIYDKRVSTNYSYSWWMNDQVTSEAWTKNDHHPMVRSEMTR
ncbi:hypothetical protein QZH41_020182 [Actinostola sp. cb2023]|nr:hypothetical protein QZH41_020182 [Actinostola sp. cb2023]